MSTVVSKNVEEEEQNDDLEYTSILPAAFIDKMIRRKFGGKPMSSTTARYTSAALEHIFAELIRAAGEEAAADKKKRIKMIHLMRAARTNDGLARFFRNYMFAPKQRVAYKSIDLLPVKERVALIKSRKEKNQMKKDNKIPGVNEE